MSLGSKNTRDGYLSWFKKWMVFCDSSDLNVIHVRRVHIDGWRLHLEAKYAPRSVGVAVASLRSFYTYLVSEELRDDNPAREVKAPSVKGLASNQVWLDDAEVGEFMAACDRASGPMRLRNRAAIALMYWCGLRVSEVCAIDGADFGYQQGQHTLAVHGKGGTTIDVVVPAQAWERVEDYIADRGRPPGALFLDRSGKRVTRKALEQAALYIAAGIVDLGERRKRVRPHVFRRSAATSLAKKNVPLHRQQDFMRHASSDTTRLYDMSRHDLDYYAGHQLVVPISTSKAS